MANAPIPKDILTEARRCYDALGRGSISDSVTTVYGQVLWHHYDAARKGDNERRGIAFQAAECLRKLWPVETQIWEDRFTSGLVALSPEGGSDG